MIFAGRKKYLQILLKYLNNLKKIKKIDEIHFWQFTNEKNEIEYIDSISNLHKTSRKFIEYKNIYQFIKNNSFTIIIKSINGKGIILINDKYEIIINICFIDINKLNDYINFIKAFKKNITIPNLINHGVSVFYNNKYGLYPDNILFKKYIHQKFSNDIFSYFIDGKQGKIIHNYFLNNINKFINNNIKPIKLDGQRPSICMFGITKESYNNVYRAKYVFKNGIIPKNYDFFDEKYTYQLLNNYLYPKLICVHYSFGPQRKFGLDELLLEKYNKIADEYFKLT